MKETIEAKAKEYVDKKQEWESAVFGEWQCPECGDVCLDPETVRSTTCHNRHSVFLSDINDHGQRAARLQD